MLISTCLEEHLELKENDYLKMLKISSENLQDTISHLNEVVQINLSDSASFIPINLRKVIIRAIDSLTMLSKSSNVTIVNFIPDGLKVSGNYAYLESIFLNLLTNGIKYKDTSKNEQKIELTYLSFFKQYSDTNTRQWNGYRSGSEWKQIIRNVQNVAWK